MYTSIPDEVLKKGDNPYGLVVAVAKRARDIVENANDNDEILTEKPISLAIEDFAHSLYTFTPPVKETAE